MKIKYLTIFLIIFVMRVMLVGNYDALSLIYAKKNTEFLDREFISSVVTDFYKKVELKNITEDQFHIRTLNSTLDIQQVFYKTKSSNDLQGLTNLLKEKIDGNKNLILISVDTSKELDSKGIFHDFIYSLSITVLIIFFINILGKRMYEKLTG